MAVHASFTAPAAHLPPWYRFTALPAVVPVSSNQPIDISLSDGHAEHRLAILKCFVIGFQK
jgi:hypothetical protein